MKELLRLDNIELGRLIETANSELAIISKSVIDDPFNTTAREINIKIKLKPEVTNLQDRSVNQPAVDWSVTHKMPGHKGMTTRAFVEGDKVIINTGDPLGTALPNQTTIFDGGK